MIFQRHLPFETLADLNDGQLPDAERVEALAHTETCARCAAELAWLARATVTLRSNELEDAPDALIARAVRLFPTAPAVRPVPSAEIGILRRLVAALTFDSGAAPLALGVRSTLPVERQLLLAVDELGMAIDLRVTPVGERWVIAGQILGLADVPHGTVALHAATDSVTDSVIEAPVSAFGEFSLGGVTAGVYELALRLADTDTDTEVVVLSLRVGA